MRYSRFRSSILGLEPQRRNRNTQNKSKVTKSKKDSKSKKEKDRESAKDEPIKSEPNTTSNAQVDVDSPLIKKECVKTEAQQQSHSQADARLTQSEMSTVSMADVQLAFPGNRLLTPCSDTEFFSSAQGYSTNHAGELLHHDQPFDYPGSTSGPCAHEPSSWQPSPSYSPFQIGAPYDLNNYTAATPGFCDHQQSPHPEGFGIAPSAMMGPDHLHVPVKHEEWDTHFH